MPEAMPSRYSRAALAAFVLGVSSILLSLASALPALYLSVQAIRNINRSEGRLRGQCLAIAGLMLSALSTLVTALGILALVLLNVQEKSQVAGCTNHLRQIGEAVQSYSDHHDHYFPPGTVPNPALEPEKRLSWEAAILTYVSVTEAKGKQLSKQFEKLAGEIAFKEAWDAPANTAPRRNVAPFLCPAFAHGLVPDQVGLTSYVGIGGLGHESATLPRSDANAGFFGYNRLLRATEISARLDATMTAIETIQDNGPWLAGGPPTVRGVDTEEHRYIGKHAAFGGLHRNGASVLWADGAVRIVTEQVNPELFRSQARIAR